MDFFSSSFNIIISILIVSAIVYTYVNPRVPKKGTAARKKYDEKMAKEELVRLNQKTIEDFSLESKPIVNPPKKTYNEPEITEKMITEFTAFTKKNKLIDDPIHPPNRPSVSKQLSEMDFQDLDVRIFAQMRAKNTRKDEGKIIISEFGINEPAYCIYSSYEIVTLSGHMDEKVAKMFVNLFDKPNLFDPFESFFDDQWDWEYYEGVIDQKYYFKDGDRKFLHLKFKGWEFDEMEILPNFQFIKSEEIEIDISSIKIHINDQKIDHQFKFKKELRHLIVLLMSIYRKDIAEQINQALKAKDS